eukprot:gene22925-29103_t
MTVTLGLLNSINLIRIESVASSLEKDIEIGRLHTEVERMELRLRDLSLQQQQPRRHQPLPSTHPLGDLDDGSDRDYLDSPTRLERHLQRSVSDSFSARHARRLEQDAVSSLSEAIPETSQNSSNRRDESDLRRLSYQQHSEELRASHRPSRRSHDAQHSDHTVNHMSDPSVQPVVVDKKRSDPDSVSRTDNRSALRRHEERVESAPTVANVSAVDEGRPPLSPRSVRTPQEVQERRRRELEGFKARERERCSENSHDESHSSLGKLNSRGHDVDARAINTNHKVQHLHKQVSDWDNDRHHTEEEYEEQREEQYYLDEEEEEEEGEEEEEEEMRDSFDRSFVYDQTGEEEEEEEKEEGGNGDKSVDVSSDSALLRGYDSNWRKSGLSTKADKVDPILPNNNSTTSTLTVVIEDESTIPTRSVSPSIDGILLTRSGSVKNSPAAGRGHRSVSFSKRVSTPQQLLKAMMKEAVADSRAYAELKQQAEEEVEVEYEYVSEKRPSGVSSPSNHMLMEPSVTTTLAPKSPAEQTFDQQRRRAIMMSELAVKKRVNEERDAAARAEKKAQEDQLLARRNKAPSYGFSNIKAGLKRQDYQESHKRLSALTAATAAAGVVLESESDQGVVSVPPVPYYMAMSVPPPSDSTASDGGDSVSQDPSPTTRKSSLVVTIDKSILTEPLSDDEDEGEDVQHQHQRRLRREAAQQQSDVREAISDNLIDQRFGWHRNYYAGSTAQQRSLVDVGSGSLPPTAKSTPKHAASSVSSPSSKKTSLLGKLPLATGTLPPLALLPLKVSVSTITSNDAPEFVSHLRKRLSSEQLQFEISLSGGRGVDSDSLDGVSLSGSHASTSTSSSHYRIVNTSTAHLPVKPAKLESIPDEETDETLSFVLNGEQSERRTQLLEQLKRSCYVDPAREISWRLAGTLKEGPKFGSSRPHFEMDVFEHSMNLRTGKLLNAYRPWSTVKTDAFDYDHFQAVMQETEASIDNLKSNAKILAPINSSPKQIKSHRSKKNVLAAARKKNQNSSSSRSLRQQQLTQQTHAQQHNVQEQSQHVGDSLLLKSSLNKSRDGTPHVSPAKNSGHSRTNSNDSNSQHLDNVSSEVDPPVGIDASRSDSFRSEASGEFETASPASKAIRQRHQKHSLPIIINVIKVVPI